MAKVDIKMPDEFLLKVSKLGSDFDPVAEKILKAGGEVIFKIKEIGGSFWIKSNSERTSSEDIINIREKPYL